MQIYIPPPSPHPFQCCAYARRRLVCDILFFMTATLNRGHGGNWTLAVLRRFTICPIVSGKDWLAYKVYNNITPASMSHIIEKTANKYKLRNAHKVNVPQFNTYYMKSSVTYRSSVISNVILTKFKHLETNINTFIKKCKEKKILNFVNFEAQSVQPACRQDDSFKYYWQLDS
jgi:hypothetical protein